MAKRPARSAKPAKKVQPKDKLLPRLTIFFFNKPLLTLFIWLALLAFGVASYTTLLKREGFPSVNIPIAIVNGTYFVNDPAKVDSEVAKPLSDLALKQSAASSVYAESSDNFFVMQIQYKEGTNATKASQELQKSVESSGKVPKSAIIQYNVPYFGATGGDVKQIDMAVSFFKDGGAVSPRELTSKTEEAAAWLRDQHITHVKEVFVKSPFEKVTNPITGQSGETQRTFDRYGQREGSETEFYRSVLIGIAADKGSDVIKLDKAVRDAVTKLPQQPQFKGYGAEVSASFAPSIEDNLSELQRVLLEGLLAVLVVGSLVIAIRASLITVISMITVVLVTLGFLYAIGYTLNVITLFALILGLALIVDDTIIMVEAIDAARHHHKDRRKVVQEATRKISRAMVAATATAALSFAPLLFVSGILGSFIKAIPVTLIAALIISLIVALIFIPLFARLLLLGKKQMGKKGVKEVAAGFEAALARFITRPMIWARRSRAKLLSVILAAMIVGFGFVGAGLVIARDVIFNIFPPTKDTNGIVINLNFPPGTTVAQAETIAAKADALAAKTIGSNFERSSYYGSGSAQSSSEQIQIISYNKRDIKSPQLVTKLQATFNKDFKDAQALVGQLDIGPPTAAFTVQINASDRDNAYKAAADIAAFLKATELKRPSGKVAHMKNVTISSPSQYLRYKAQPIVTVGTSFDADDTTTLVTLAEDAIKGEFTDQRMHQYGLKASDLRFDIGQESENQDSFKTLALAFPALLVVIFILLAVQFRSLLQPLLIFTAIPFSIFGVMLGLRITNNAISFFTMMGFFALVGLSIKNTILLTDYANQARRQGMVPIDAAVEALQERFRPLFATSMTAVVSLIPLAISSPFWEGLAVVLIFGLLSSTFLVVTVFPYYYLAAEILRTRIRAIQFFLWLIPTVALILVVSKLTNAFAGLLVIPLSFYLLWLYSFFRRQRQVRA